MYNYIGRCGARDIRLRILIDGPPPCLRTYRTGMDRAKRPETRSVGEPSSFWNRSDEWFFFFRAVGDRWSRFVYPLCTRIVFVVLLLGYWATRARMSWINVIGKNVLKRPEEQRLLPSTRDRLVEDSTTHPRPFCLAQGVFLFIIFTALVVVHFTKFINTICLILFTCIHLHLFTDVTDVRNIKVENPVFININIHFRDEFKGNTLKIETLLWRLVYK